MAAVSRLHPQLLADFLFFVVCFSPSAVASLLGFALLPLSWFCEVSSFFSPVFSLPWCSIFVLSSLQVAPFVGESGVVLGDLGASSFSAGGAGTSPQSSASHWYNSFLLQELLVCCCSSSCVALG